jgi:hypothetical protein
MMIAIWTQYKFILSQSLTSIESITIPIYIGTTNYPPLPIINAANEIINSRHSFPRYLSSLLVGATFLSSGTFDLP